MDNIDLLTIENQLCFPLYVCSKEIIKKYKPYLDKLGLTYTQYITMMVLWEEKEINVKSLGDKLYLDSGTLTPLLKKLENKQYIKRNKSSKDERKLIISITPKGEELKILAKDIPTSIGKCLNLTKKESVDLYKILYKILNKIN
ncbi:MAG: MarR family transcriptional regulator [Bacilli bacterium]|nr:MarR family transcriptional regulator [Bacilli bacterium]